MELKSMRFSASEATEGVSAQVREAVQAWVASHEVAEVRLALYGDYYAIHVNANPNPVPGVYVPAAAIHEPGLLIEILDAAYQVYFDELSSHSN